MEEENEETTQEVVSATSVSKAVVLYSPKEEHNLIVFGDPLPIIEMSWNADWAWTRRVQRLVVDSARFKFLLAWSSTLGGAYSALGENITANAEVAGLISCLQLALAGRMGDDLLASRSKLYAAYSLLQRSHIHQAARIVREQYQYISKDSPVKDKQLEAMCVSIWKRLQHLYKMRKLRRLPSTSLITPYSISLLSSPQSSPQASPLHPSLASPQTTSAPSSPCHSPSPPPLSSPRTSSSTSLEISDGVLSHQEHD